MKQIYLVAIREFLTQVKNKTFLVMTFLTPILLVAFVAVIVWMKSANTDVKSFAVVDESGEFITTLASSENEIYNFYKSSDIQGIKDTLLNSETLNGLLFIPKFQKSQLDSLDKKIELTTNSNLGVEYKSRLESKINQRIKDMKMESAGVSQDQLDKMQSNISIRTFNLKDGSAEGQEETGELIKFFMGLALAYAIFTFVMIYGIKVMRSVVEEKNNRVVEIIISSVKPFNLMMGKILGTTLVAFTQFFIWIVMGLVLMFGASAFFATKLKEQTEVINAQSAELMAGNMEWMEKSQDVLNSLFEMNIPVIILWFILFFFFGYLFYSSVFAAIGSAVDNETDTQQFTFYPMIPMTIAIYGSFTSLDNPDGPVNFWLSMIPFTSPISMVTRLPFGVPWWQLILSLVLLIGTTILTVRFAAKIYRVGILMYGKKPSLKEMWKWLKYSD